MTPNRLRKDTLMSNTKAAIVDFIVIVFKEIALNLLKLALGFAFANAIHYVASKIEARRETRKSKKTK